MKLLIITDQKKPHKLAHKLFGGQMKTVSGNEIEKIIQTKNPNYVLFNLKSKHDDMESIITGIDSAVVHSFGQ